jgi:hypothetical protein
MSSERWIRGSIVLGIAASIGAMMFDARDQYHAALVPSERRGPTAHPASKASRERAVFDMFDGRGEASRLVDDGPGIAFVRHTSPSTTRAERAAQESVSHAPSASGSVAAPHASSASQRVTSGARTPGKFSPTIEVDRIVGDATLIGPIVQGFAARVTERCRVEHELAGDRLALRLQITGDEQGATVALASLGSGPEADDVSAAECVERVANDTMWPSVSGRTVVIARVRYIAALTSAADVFLKAP